MEKGASRHRKGLHSGYGKTENGEWLHPATA
jgi:hypothetical protein